MSDSEIDFKSVTDDELPSSYARLVLAYTDALQGRPDLWWELPSWIALPHSYDTYTSISRRGLDPLPVVSHHTPAGIFVKYAPMEWP